ncbi:MAG: restriction endonuclease subunit S, partial [Methylophilaceae bacterium]|nr:restriction endonuclease subunit S [Methylophilaceae bacterium]
MAEWKTEPLDQCLESLIDYRGKSPTKSRTGIPVLSAKVVKTTGLLRPIEQTIAPDYYPQWMTRGLPRPGDVVMTTEAPMGEVIQLNEETSKFALGQRIVCMRGKAGKLDNTFLRYLLTSPGQQEILASYSTGTTVLGISQKALRSVPISYPDFDEQVIIGELLSALDDKIELNRQMNETLEASARALFRDWFVDFGPTRAKMAGAAPYLAPDLWSLFPDRLDDEGKPEGWERSPLKELLVLQRGFDLPKDTRTDGAFPVIAASGPSGTHNEMRVSGPGICTGRSGVLGGVYYITQDFWPLNTSLWIKDYPNSTPLHALHVLQEIDISAFNAGSAVPTLNRNHIHEMLVIKPAMPVVTAFDQFAGEFYRRREAN